MEPTNANFTPEYMMKVLEMMSKQIQSLQTTIGEQDQRIQALALENLKLREATSTTEMMCEALESRISTISQGINEGISTLNDNLLAESISNAEFQQVAGEFYDSVGLFNNEILERVQILEKKAGIVFIRKVTEEGDKEAIERTLVSPKFDPRPVSLGKSTATPKENKFLKKLEKVASEIKAPTTTVVVHTSGQDAEHKGRARFASNMSPNDKVNSDSDTF